MSETIRTILGNKVWRPEDMEKDLKKTGLLEGFFFLLHSQMVSWTDCTGLCGAGNPMIVTWIANRLLMVSTMTYCQQMIDAFSAVVEYKPFCKYRRERGGESLFTTEWSKEDIQPQIKELQNDPEVHDLELL